MEDEVQKATAQSLFLARADELKSKPLLTRIFTAYKKQEHAASLNTIRRFNETLYQSVDIPFLTRDSKGVPEATIANFKNIMLFDKYYDNIKFNTLANYAERHVVNEATREIVKKRWTDADEAASKEYIEEKYGIYSDRKHYDALRILWKEREYNPVVDILNSLQWDGKERCERFLTDIAKADDTPYVHECSRLIFAGGVWRMMMPGCKMDDVVVLIGRQGAGKSSLVKFLAIHDDFFGEIKKIEGKEAIEQFEGKWICEISELAAMTKAKEVEAVKAFITRQKDNYRKPYDRNVDDRPRQCIFIGSTNNPNFLIDLTGNRRFYPVQTHFNGYELYDDEANCREYILQCWAEAMVKYKEHRMPNYARRDLVNEYRKAQDDALQDDWRIGAVQTYLDDKPVGAFVCIKELMTEVISPDHEHPQNPTPKDSKDLGIMMSMMDGWEKSPQMKHTLKYGRQRGWVKVTESEPSDVDYDRTGELPF